MDKYKSIKAVFVDLDGTLLFDAGTITNRVSRSFMEARNAGIKVIVCTGRVAHESDFAIEAIGANECFIANNGLSIYSDYKNRKLLYDRRLSLDTGVRFARYIEDNYPIYIQAYIDEYAYNSEKVVPYFSTSGMPVASQKFFTSNMVVVDNLPAFMEDNKKEAYKFLVGTEDHSLLKSIRIEIDRMFPDIDTLSSQPYFLEVLPKDVDKAQAVRLVRDYLGLSRDEVMVIGDSENDLGMLREGGLSVAMGNAYDEVKELADVIAPTNKEDGAAWAVEELLKHLGG